MNTELELQDGFAEFLSSPDRRRSKQVELGTEWYLHTLGEGKSLHLFWIESTQELVAAELAGPASIVMPGRYVHAEYTGKYTMLGKFSTEDIQDLVGIDGGTLDIFVNEDELDDMRNGIYDEAPEM
jgi:hypothetical protein